MNSKVAMVTAGAGGIGAATARKLVADEFSVVILDTSDAVEALGSKLGGVGIKGSN